MYSRYLMRDMVSQPQWLALGLPFPLPQPWPASTPSGPPLPPSGGATIARSLAADAVPLAYRDTSHEEQTTDAGKDVGDEV